MTVTPPPSEPDDWPPNFVPPEAHRESVPPPVVPGQSYVRTEHPSRSPSPEDWGPAKPTKTRWPLIIALVALLLLGCIVGVAVLASSSTDKPKAPATKAATKAPTTKAKSAGPATSIGDGTWTAGKDIKAGTWRPVKDANSGCYFQVSTKDGKMDVERLNLGGGRPTFKIAAGESVKITGCPEFRVS